MHIVMIGATGATGSALLSVLLNEPSVTQISVLVRRPIAITHEKLQVHLVDFHRPDSWQQWVKGDAAFSCLGTTAKDTANRDEYWQIDYGYQWQFAQFAKQHGIKHFVLLSAMFAHPHAKVFYLKMKGQLEHKITDLGFKHLSIFRPPSLLRPNTDRLGEKVTVALLKILNRAGLFKSQKPVPVDVLAHAMWYAVAHEQTGIIDSRKIWQWQ